MNILIKITIALSLSSFCVMADYINIKTYDDHIKQLKKTKINGYEISYIDEGKGKPIVLMHGIPTNSWLFRNIIPGLVKGGYRVIAPDLLGMGQSDKPKKKEDFLVPMQAKAMKDLLFKKLKLNTISLVVHDFGGPISFEMLADPEVKVKNLFIFNTFAFRKGFSPRLNTFSKMGMKLMTTRPLRRKFYCLLLEAMVVDKKNMKLEVLDGYLRPLLNGASFTYKQLYFSIADLKLKENLTRYQQNLVASGIENVKIIWGKYDPFLDSSIQLNAFKNLLDVSDENVLVLEKSKHLITEEEPKKILKMILN